MFADRPNEFETESPGIQLGLSAQPSAAILRPVSIPLRAPINLNLQSNSLTRYPIPRHETENPKT